MISRNEFMKLSGIAYASLLFGFPKLEGADMISDLFEKLNRGERLNPVEMEQFKSRMNELENKVSYWSQNGPDTLHAKKLWTQDAFFQNMPMSFMVLDRTSNFSVPHNDQTTVTDYDAYTPVSGDRVTASNDFFELDGANGRIYIKQTGRMIGFYVFNTWAENPDGYRAARISQYTKEGASISHSVVYRIPACASGRTTLGTFIMVPWGGARGVGDYGEVSLYQDSGVAIYAEYTAFGAFVLR